MKFGVWYGMALWFLILKGLNVEPCAEWSWWFVLIPIAWPTCAETVQFVVRDGARALGQVVLAHLFVRTLGGGKRGNGVCGVCPLDPKPGGGQPLGSTFRSAASRTPKSG